MNQAMKRIISFAFVLILVVSLAAPAFAAGKVYTLDGNVTVGAGYVGSDGRMQVTVCIATGTKKFSIDKNKIKLTKGTAGAELAVCMPYQRTWSSKVQYKDGTRWKASGGSGKSCEFSIGFYAKQPGNTKLTYYVGKTKHTATITVTDKYRSPVKTMTLTGVNGGKNFPVRKDKGSGTLTLNADVKNAKLKIVPAKNWQLRSMSINDNTTYDREYLGMPLGNSPSMPGSGLTSGVINWGRLVKGHTYYINAYFFNTKTFEVQDVSYEIVSGS